jgi:hypothetical protein
VEILAAPRGGAETGADHAGFRVAIPASSISGGLGTGGTNLDLVRPPITGSCSGPRDQKVKISAASAFGHPSENIDIISPPPYDSRATAQGC